MIIISTTYGHILFFQMVWNSMLVGRHLTLSYIMLKNSQTYFKNYAVFKPQDFKSLFGYFSTLYMKGSKRMIKLIKKTQHKNLTIFDYCITKTTIMDIIFWEFLILYHKFYFHHKWNEAWLLVINMVYTSCLTSCQTT